MKKIILIIVATAVVAGSGAFYGGLKYAESKNSASQQNVLANFRANGGQGFRQGRTGNDQGGANFVNGDIIAKDDKSITVKLRSNETNAGANSGSTAGGSKIVFFSAATQIMKSDSGSVADLKVGDNVMANGSANPDGSVIASSIQIRPATPATPKQP